MTGRTVRTVPPVRRATADDAAAVGRLLDAFNREYDAPTPGPEVLQDRVRRMIAAGEIVVFLIGGGPAGLAVITFRPSLWSDVHDVYLAELYVVPDLRGRGLGHALLLRSIDEAVATGAAIIDVDTTVEDVDAVRLYQSVGFVNDEDEPGSTMVHYELALPAPTV